MVAGIGEAFSKPFLASVFASRPSCLYLNRRQKVYPKLKPFLASDFSLLGWFLGTNIFVETLYSVFACTYKQAELIGLFPSQLNHRQASICMLLRCSKNTGGVLELVRNFTDVLRSWLWRRNPVQWLWSYECIGCRHLLFWEFVLRGLRNLAPKILKLVSGQVAVIFTFQWHVGRLLEVLAGCFWVWYFPAGPAVADALVCLSFGVARLPAPGLFEVCLRWLVAAWQPSRIGNDCVWVFAWCHSSCHLQIRVIHDDLNVLSLRLSAEWSDD